MNNYLKCSNYDDKIEKKKETEVYHFYT